MDKEYHWFFKCSVRITESRIKKLLLRKRDSCKRAKHTFSSNLLQVAYAIAGGFLFTILFYYSKSLWACIATHSILNALSVFAKESAKTPAMEMLSAAALILISVLYAGYIVKAQRKCKRNVI